MEMKLFGAVLVIVACAGFGFSVAADYRKRERILLQLFKIIRTMQSELQYKLTPLPELVMISAREADGALRQLFLAFNEELNRRLAPDAMSCMRSALAKNKIEQGAIRSIILELAAVLGKYDLEGQIKGLSHVQQLCSVKMEELRHNRTERIRCYQTLGMCAGVALVILFA